MAHPQIAVFARLADKGAPRVRAIEGQATLLGRTMHGIAYDEVHDEIVVPHQFAQAVLTFSGDAAGDTPPTRVIRGPKTQLIALDRVAVDPVHDEIVVPDGDRVLVFPREADGDVAPTRVLTGPDTRIGDAQAVAIDPVHDLLVVSSTPSETIARGDSRGELTVFRRTAAGNTKPLRVVSNVRGSRIAVSPERGLIFVAMGDHVGVWSVDDEGPAPPRFTVGGPGGVLRSLRGVAVDAKNKTVIVTDKELNAVLTFHAPEVFDGQTAQLARW